jgi:hypothetical protein
MYIYTYKGDSGPEAENRELDAADNAGSRGHTRGFQVEHYQLRDSINPCGYTFKPT